jgi:hypothetical protein
VRRGRGIVRKLADQLLGGASLGAREFGGHAGVRDERPGLHDRPVVKAQVPRGREG